MSQNTALLYALREQVESIREVTANNIHGNGITVSDDAANAPWINHLKNLIAGMHHCTNSEHYLIIVSNFFDTIRVVEDSLDVLVPSDIDQLLSVVSAISDFNMRATLTELDTHLAASSYALDSGITRSEDTDRIQKTILSMLSTESRLSGLKANLDSNKPPHKKIAF
jgi:hypothetical protein